MDVRDFKKFSFVTASSPATWGVVVLVILVGASLAVWPQVLEPSVLISPMIFSAVFIGTTLLSGLIVDGLVPGFKSKWAYLVVLVNQVLLIAAFLVFQISSKITFLDSFALWTVVAYTAWLLILTGLAAIRIGPKSILLSLVQPAFMWGLVMGTLEVGVISPTPVIIMVSGMFVATLIVLFNEHLFSLVFAGISGMAELSKFFKGLRGEQVELDIGHSINAPLQYLKFKVDGGKESVIVAPWLHSGPIRSVGGGNLSTQCIEELNKEYNNSYFLHVPSSHEYNPSGKVAERVVDSVKHGGYSNLKVSKVVKSEEGGIIVRGQRFNDVYLISLSSELIDDYDISIFASLKERYKDKKVVFIDSHPNFPMKKCVNVEAFSKEAQICERLIDSVMSRLSKEPLSTADAGTALQTYDSYSVFALVLKSRGETTLYFIADTNGLSDNEIGTIRKTADELGIDHTLFFTTDTHALSVKALIERQDIAKAIIESTMQRAVDEIKTCEFAYGEAVLENVLILGETYYELATMVKILARVMPILFVLLYLFLTILLWIF